MMMSTVETTTAVGKTETQRSGLLAPVSQPSRQREELTLNSSSQNWVCDDRESFIDDHVDEEKRLKKGRKVRGRVQPTN